MKPPFKIVLYTSIGVIIFFILYFIIQFEVERKLSMHTTASTPATTTTKENDVQSVLLPDAKIAFVNIDTINEKYLYIADYVKSMKKRKETIEAQLQSMMNQFQKDYETFQQSVQAGIAPQAELEKQKRKLEQQQKDIQNKQLQMDNLAVELQEKNEQLQKDMKAFMKRFNNGKYDYILSYSDALPNVLFANPQYDITNEVLQALNKEYLESKNKGK